MPRMRARAVRSPPDGRRSSWLGPLGSAAPVPDADHAGGSRRAALIGGRGAARARCGSAAAGGGGRCSASRRANQRAAVAFTRAQRTSSALAIGIPGATGAVGAPTRRAPARRWNTSPYREECVRAQNGHW